MSADLPIISLREAAAATGISYSALWRAVRRGALDAQQIGTIWVTTPRAVTAYAAASKSDYGKRFREERLSSRTARP